MICDGVILDIDGTIWNTTEIVAEAWNKAIDENYPQVPHVSSDILKQQFGKTMDVIADNLFTCLNSVEKKILLDKCCEYEQKYIEENTADITYPKVVETINKLAEKVKLYIVSNCQKGYIELIMKKNQIEKCISDSECFGNNNKEKWENIRLICKRNNLKNPVYVGDTQGDYLACVKADVPFIWASYGFGKPDNYFMKIENFSELLEIL